MTAPFETPLDVWIGRATRDLSVTSAAHVRAEIQEHFESAREAAIGAGSSPADADRAAVAENPDADGSGDPADRRDCHDVPRRDRRGASTISLKRGAVRFPRGALS